MTPCRLRLLDFLIVAVCLYIQLLFGIYSCMKLIVPEKITKALKLNWFKDESIYQLFYFK